MEFQQNPAGIPVTTTTAHPRLAKYRNESEERWTAERSHEPLGLSKVPADRASCNLMGSRYVKWNIHIHN